MSRAPSPSARCPTHPAAQCRLRPYRGAGDEGLLAQDAGDAYTWCLQYTISGVPNAVDAALRRRARALDRSLNEVVVEALANGVGLRATRHERRDVTDIAGTWTRERAVEAALAARDTVDEGLWR